MSTERTAQMSSRIVIGVDTGGTFTDFVCVEGGRVRIHKVPSTPADPAEAVLRGVRELLGRGTAGMGRAVGAESTVGVVRTAGAGGTAGGVGHMLGAGRTTGAGRAVATSSTDGAGRAMGVPDVVLYGTTVATNALIQRRGAKTALVTTAGFEDVIEIGRQVREKIYDMNVLARPPVVGRSLRVGVGERTAADGVVLAALSRPQVARIASLLKQRGVVSVAVCFLNSYANPANELAAKKILSRSFRDVYTSFEVLPEYREYERFSTTCANAYVAPLLREHLARLGPELGGARILVMQSNGGLASAAHAAGSAVQSVLSGPAAGVLGGFGVAREAGLSRAITFDMGGTSTDVSLCDGQIGFRSDAVVGGCPIKTPIVDVHTVGAGGGSVAWVDRGGALRVGPRSAGADPGPACYGKGADFTVTDANLLLGRLQSDYFLGGRMVLHPERAKKAALALSRRLGPSWGLGARAAAEKTAEAVLDVANATMLRAIKVVSVERGHDPSDFVLVAFGGAAPLHAVDLARALGVKRILVPVDPGVLCARGLLTAPIIRDFSRTVLSRAVLSRAAGRSRDTRTERGAARPGERAESSLIERELTRMERLGLDYLSAEGVRPGAALVQRYVDVRYVGQSYEITVPYGRKFRDAFHAAHERLYGHSSPERETEVVNVRVRAAGTAVPWDRMSQQYARATGAAGRFRLTRPQRADRPSERRPRRGRAVQSQPEPARRVETYASGRFRPTPLYERAGLLPGSSVVGPALVAEDSSTTYVPGDARCWVDSHGNLILET